MLNLKKIAVIGAIASGKSTVCDYLLQKNAYVVNADKIGHELLNIQTSTGKQILDLLGPDVLTDGQFDRKKIAKIVFNDRVKLKALEKIIHPQILQEIEKQYENIKKSKFSFFVADIPLLYEMKHEKFYDYILFIDADQPLCEKRFENQGFLPGEYKLRMENQISIEEKKQLADFVLQNNSSMKILEENLDSVLTKFNLN